MTGKGVEEGWIEFEFVKVEYCLWVRKVVGAFCYIVQPAFGAEIWDAARYGDTCACEDYYTGGV